MTTPPLLVILDARTLDDLADADCLDLFADSPDVRLAVAADARAGASERARIALRDVEAPLGVRARAARERVPVFDEDDLVRSGERVVLVSAPGTGRRAPAWPHIVACTMSLSGALHDRKSVAEAVRLSTAGS